MTAKKDKQFFFEVQLNWLEGRRGVLSAKNAAGTIHVATPPEFGGEGKPWSPEHLFLSAISSCYMTTFLAFAERLHLEILKMDYQSVGQIELVEDRYKFTEINLYPRVFIAEESLRGLTATVIEKTHKYSLITNSVNASIYYHPAVLIADQSPKANEITFDGASNEMVSEADINSVTHIL
ncbi:MAG: OsmC family protein [Bacteroidetes bacterium]|nr:OsmC family protein [Bacteroidota bacterium]